MSFEAPYLEAIQALPGNTPTEKHKWIAKLIKNRMGSDGESMNVTSWQEIPKPLLPLVEVEAGKMSKKYEAITKALKSEDHFVVTRALQAEWYFDGRNKDVINVDYFFRNIFPYVSLKTRKKIVKKLSQQLPQNESKVAEEFFLALAKTYGIDHTTLRLLRACSESFAYDAILRHKIVLSESLLRIMFLTKPNLVIRYLKLDEPTDDPLVRNPYQDSIYQYSNFLPKLVRQHLEDFLEIFERFEKTHPPTVKLSKKSAVLFLKHARERVQAKPKLFIKILPLKLIDASFLESIFLKLFPQEIESFNTDRMLLYLKHYPEERRATLLLKSYEEVYGKNLLDDVQNVTSELLKILPEEQRYEQARRLISEKPNRNMFYRDWSMVWRCYLPINEVIPAIKKEISTTKLVHEREALVVQMIYSCKINHDDDALLDVLNYANKRFKNEVASVWKVIFTALIDFYDITVLSKDHWNVIEEIFQRNFVKNELFNYYDATYRTFLQKALLYKFKNDLPIDKMIDIYVDLERQYWSGKWNILSDYPEYQLKCFEASLRVIEKKFKANDSKWNDSKIYIVGSILNEICDYNKRQVKPNSGREKLSLKNYPWLVDMVKNILTDIKQDYLVNDIKVCLKTNEKDLYEALVDETEEIVDVASGAALQLLKNHPESVLNKWPEYLENCIKVDYEGHIKHFLVACRWYKDIPIKFTTEAVKRLQTDNNDAYLRLLGILLYGDTFTRLIRPYVPTEKEIDVNSENAKNNYGLLINALKGMLVSNPPVPIELIDILCQGDYLSLALRVLTNVSNRTSITKIRTFANDLVGKRVTVRKHGIRLICKIATLQESAEFLLSQWRIEEHHSIREVIFSKMYQLFQKEPWPQIWSVFRELVSTLKLKDWPTMKANLILSTNIPTEYVFDLISLIMTTTDNFVKEGLDREQAMYYLLDVFGKINASVANVLPDEFCERIIEKYLFDPDYVVDNFLRDFVVQKYLFLRMDKIDKRLAVLSRLFARAVESGWNKSHPRKLHFYPVNYTVCTIVNNIVSTFLSREEKDPKVIDGVLNFYDTFLTPEMDITSYFLLIHTKEYIESSTTVEFARRLGEKIPQLIEKHTPLYPDCIIETLQYFFAIICVRNLEDVKLTVVETLLECSSVYAHLVAVSSLPTINTSANVLKYNALVERLRKNDNPAIRSIIYRKINALGFHSCTVNS